MGKEKPTITLRQVIGLLLLLALFLSVRLFIHFLPALPPPETVSTDTLATDTAEQDMIVLRPFDPNTADSLTLRRLGLTAGQTKSLLRYRAKGGRWRKAEDLKRLYGINDSIYQALLPYICIDTMPFYAERKERHLRDSLRRDSIQQRYNARRDSFEQARQLRHDSLLKAGIIHLKADTVIEINTADTNSLQYIRGIGKYSAVQIIRYRQQLGGYHSLEQLREIDNLDYMAWDSVMPHLRVDTTLISKINVQTASVERLMHHPYISFTQAKKLYEKRRRNIRLKDMDELVPAVFTNEEAGRIKPYLDFTPPPKPSRR